MLSPKRLKFRKMHKGRIHGLAKGGSELSFGSYGLKALTPDRITAARSRLPSCHYPRDEKSRKIVDQNFPGCSCI